MTKSGNVDKIDYIEAFITLRSAHIGHTLTTSVYDISTSSYYNYDDHSFYRNGASSL